MPNNLQHQKDLNGCGIASISNLLNKSYDWVKQDFESKFYTIERGINISDVVRYLNTHGLKYKSKFFNQKKFNKKEANKFSKIMSSITLIAKSKKYPIGHYLLRIKNGWLDPWYDLPSIDNVRAGVRRKLPENPWYVMYPLIKPNSPLHPR